MNPSWQKTDRQTDRPWFFTAASKHVSRRIVMSDPPKNVLSCAVCHNETVQMKSLDSFPNGVENEWSFGTNKEKLSKLHSLASEVVVLVDLFDNNEHDNEGV